MSPNLQVPVVPSVAPQGQRYNNWAFEPILHQEFNKLKARMMNLGESMTADRTQANAVKGLMRDFIQQAYFESLRGIEDFCRDKGVIQEGEGQLRTYGPDKLDAKSLDDIFVS